MGRPEDKYVKLPAVIHATRLGYSYHSIRDKISGLDWDADTNIFYEQFKQGLEKVNGKQFNNEQIEFFIQELKIKLNAEDIGRAFFKALQKGLGDIKLIDFENSDNNLFHVVTELPYVCGDDSFRPDITFLINGMPLAFMEAKRQNNKEGILAERARMATRFSKSIYRNFVNITQLMVFSNNQEYDDEERLPIHGSFYASSAYGEPSFSRFREERSSYVDKS
ncbi:MAG: type I restriction endonuclease, partial [Actinomycetia bacterium]|nr:type I restriction endonuclease [Actinomycetes bacterium]